MKKKIIPVQDFDLDRLIATVATFWKGQVPSMPDHEVAFPVVQNGFADFGTACLEDDADAVGDTLAYFASMTGDGWVATDIAIYTMGGEPVLTMQDVYTDADGRFVFHRFNQRIGAI